MNTDTNKWLCTLRITATITALAMYLSAEAGAIEINNTSIYNVRVTISNGLSWTTTIQAGNSTTCTNLICNPGGNPNAYWPMEIESTGATPNYFGRVEIQANGRVLIQSPARPWNLPPDIHVMSFNNADETLDETYYGGLWTDPPSRSVQFLASADCQYTHYHCCDAQGNEVPNEGPCIAPYVHQCPGSQAWNDTATAVNARMRSEMDANSAIRGILYAGDLTQGAGFNTEYQWYLDSWRGSGTAVDLAHYVYDGQGNHDLANAGENQIMEELRTRARSTVRTIPAQVNLPHYSWDWHDVHFVQLNLMPSDLPTPGSEHLNPRLALWFLQNDLQQFVGTSGRPVVLIHHYGLDGFSTAEPDPWWTADQRLAYWNAIAIYNVVGIFTGHWHALPTEEVHTRWHRPDGTSAGPSYVDTWTSGAARHGTYLHVTMQVANQILVQVKDQNGTGAPTYQTYCELKGGAIHVNAGFPSQGDGSPLYPLQTAAEALSRVDLLDPLCREDLHVSFAAGTYQETATISQPMTLMSNGGVARIGQP